MGGAAAEGLVDRAVAFSPDECGRTDPARNIAGRLDLERARTPSLASVVTKLEWT
jgi:hypothetical protein